jgi:fucose 4-O-acetylase-like acetyltransferase
MDALRASTMLLLVPLHAAGLLAGNGHGGAWAIAVFWAIHIFRLPLFFAMSGFFLALMLSRKGLRGTARNRTMRIAVPLAVGVVTLVPLYVALSQATGTVIAANGRLTEGSPFLLQPSFLWFLWYLLIVDGIAIAAYLILPNTLQRLGLGLRTAIARPLWGISLLAIPTTLALWSQPSWMAVPQSQNFVPDPVTLAYYAIFFALGATLCVHRDLVDSARRDAWKWTACACAATLPAAALFTLHNSPDYANRIDVHGAALLIYAIATWTSLIALVGLASRYVDRPHRAVRYMADSSYWIYLSHLPAMVLVVALVGVSTLGTAPAFLLVTAASLTFSLLTYPLFVRYTVIGRTLNGPRARRPKRHGRVRPAPMFSPSASATR